MRKSVLFLILGFLTIPAFGDVEDVATLLHDTYLDNWTIVADHSSTWTGSFEMSVHSSVYENTAGDYTFVFDVVPTVDGVFALNLGGDFSSAQQAEGLHSPGGAGTLFFNVDFEGDMSVVILPSVDTGGNFTMGMPSAEPGGTRVVGLMPPAVTVMVRPLSPNLPLFSFLALVS